MKGNLIGSQERHIPPDFGSDLGVEPRKVGHRGDGALLDTAGSSRDLVALKITIVERDEVKEIRNMSPYAR
jgi:hypothetical protein